MRQTALSASPTSTIGSGVSRLKSPTRSVRNVTESGTVAFRGSGEPLASEGCVAVPAFASRERSVISSAMRGKRSTKPAAVTCAFASSLTSDHIVWSSRFSHAAAYCRATGSGEGGPGVQALLTAARITKSARATLRARGLGGNAPQPLIPSGLALAARIGAPGERAVRFDRDRLRATGHRCPVVENGDLMPLRRERATHRLRVPALHLQGSARFVEPPRLLDRALHVHTEVDQRDGELEVGLHLRVAARRTKHETWRGSIEHDDRVQRVHRTLAADERVRGASIEREAGQPVVQQQTRSRDDHRRAERAEDALDQRDRIPITT